jgi:hypothetical protein
MGINDAVKDNELSNKERFYGEGDEGVSHAEFERSMEGYCKEQWGPKLGEEIWHDKLLDLGTISFDSAANLETFNAHVKMSWIAYLTEMPRRPKCSTRTTNSGQSNTKQLGGRNSTASYRLRYRNCVKAKR